MEQDKIWDYFQTEELKSFEGSYSRLYDLVKEFKQGDHVLNIGVGGGVFEKLAIEYGLIVYSLDPSKNTIDKIKNVVGSENAKIGYSQAMPFGENIFDGVVMSEVLEHLNDEIISQTLVEIKRVLKFDGKFIGTVPYNENLNEQIVICPKCGEKFHRWGHIQSFSENKLYKLLSTEFNKTKVNKIRYMNTNPFTLKGKIIKPMHDLLFYLGIKKLGLNIKFIARI